MNLIFTKKKTETLLIQFWTIIYITSEFNFYEKKTETLLVQFWTIIYVISEFNFMKKNKHFTDSILGNYLHN